MNDEIARAAAARLIAAACRGQGPMWTEQERRHRASASAAEAEEVAAPLLAVCEGCAIVTECSIWAAVDRYTGIAAGRAWQSGRPGPAGCVPGHPVRGDGDLPLAS